MIFSTCGTSHRATERVQLHRRSPALTKHRRSLLALWSLALDHFRVATENLPTADHTDRQTSAATATAARGPRGTLVNPNFRFGRRYSLDNGLVLLCAASRDTMITFGVETSAGDAASVP